MEPNVQRMDAMIIKDKFPDQFKIFLQIKSDRYKGCYVDADGDRIFEIQAYKVDGNGVNSNGICIGNCSGRGYTFAGTQADTECYCGNNYDYDRHGLTPDECNRECRNYANEISSVLSSYEDGFI
ncbi:hypothetical protein CAPTEDRAFT_192763 [Capitella teleta]|uniref:WSC domain-containing protein n=1 Tax=Capitella teleta TaxID=283909 RepID=R7VDZ6_CAPTE|nr:hypothetical protein CAPTEDRAFT_192763 [Capitella teleta]|eukprot:ELU16849.1 hypothetical protein CAPTEDRAFT_192763 [Capitella teleta]